MTSPTAAAFWSYSYEDDKNDGGAALVDTTFFIPVITNRYFERDECRRELLDFSTKAQSLGVWELVCPILYVPVEGLSGDSSDEAMALIGRTQWEDWTRLRLQGEKSELHRSAVNKMATRLSEVAIAVGGRQLQAERVMSEETDLEGLGETLDQIRALLPEWLDTAETL